MKIKGTLIVLLVACAACVTPANGALRYLPGLAQLEGVAVLIEDLPEFVKEAELSKSNLRTSAELCLRRAGIKVLSPEEASHSPRNPTLYVHVAVVESESGKLSGMYEVEFHQDVLIDTTPKATRIYSATTWGGDTGGVFYVSREKFRKLVLDQVELQVDVFCNDYLKANPHQQPAPK